jgi:hypothetical protein
MSLIVRSYSSRPKRNLATTQAVASCILPATLLLHIPFFVKTVANALSSHGFPS